MLEKRGCLGWMGRGVEKHRFALSLHLVLCTVVVLFVKEQDQHVAQVGLTKYYCHYLNRGAKASGFKQVTII